MRNGAWLGAVGVCVLMYGAGCSGGKPPAPAPQAPAPPASAPAVPVTSAPAPSPAALKECSIDAETLLRDRLAKVVAESPLWKTYFAHRQAQPGTKMPFVAKQLKEFGAPAAPAMVKAITSKDWSTYVEGTRALAALGKDAAPAVPALIEQAKQRDPLRRDAAVEVLAKIGAPLAEPLKEALAAAKSDEAAAAHLITALERLGPDAKPALPLLEELSKSPSRALSNRAKAAIKEIAAP